MGKFIGEKSISYVFQVVRNYINECVKKLSEINDNRYSLISHTHTFPISNSAVVNESGKCALDAIEKNPSISGTMANSILTTKNRLNSQLYTGFYVNTLNEFVEGIIGIDQSVRFKAGNIKILDNFIPGIEEQIAQTSWFQFIATWQNHYSNETYGISLRVILAGSGMDSDIYQVYIEGNNGNYIINRVINLTPFHLGIDDKGNYGYYKKGSTTLTPF